jgi:hypothetical protein
VHGGGVVGIHVEHAHCDALVGQVLEPSESERPAEAQALRVWVDTDDVDLAEDGRRVVMDLRPAEGHEPALALVEEEAGGVEPRLTFPGLDRVERPAPLLWMVAEGAIVHLQPRRLVAPGDERAGRHVHGETRRQRPPHLVEQAPLTQADGGGEAGVLIVGVRDPPVDVAATLARDGVDGDTQHVRRDRLELAATRRVNDQLEAPRVVAA